MLPLEELKRLDGQVASATELGLLKPIFQRMAEIGHQNTDDFEVQLAVAGLRQHILDKGLALKDTSTNGSKPVDVASPPPPSSHLAVFELPAPSEHPASVSPPLNIRRAIMIGAGLGVTAWLIIFVILVQIARNHNMPKPPASVAAAGKAVSGGVPVDIVTTPAGAAIRINGETKCKSNCRISLPPGNYQVTALLDGFDPSATGVTVVPGNPINVTLSLMSQTQTLRLFTDLEGGAAVLDGQPAIILQDGQLVLDRVKAGKHTLRVAGKNGEARIQFETLIGKPPVITAPVTATTLLAIAVTSLGNQAKLQSSSATPLKVALNGQAKGDAGPSGLDLKDVPLGDQTLTIGEGKDQRKLVVPFGPTPSLTAFLKADVVDKGTLVVSTGEDGATVFVNGTPYWRKTKRGELRIQTLGSLTVKVAKPGFEPPPEQTVEIKKGEETRVAFVLTPVQTVAALEIRNGVVGTQVLIDDRPAGRVDAGGAFAAANLQPGEHSIEMRRDGFVPRRVSRTLKAGEIVVLNGPDVALAAAAAALHLIVSPPDATVTYRRNDESQSHAVQGSTLKLDPGSYIFTAKAPNFVERSERTTVTGGESRNLELALVREPPRPPVVVPAKPAPTVNWAGWSQEGADYVRKGGDRVVLRSGQLPGTITFTAHLRKGGRLFRGGKVRWFVEDGDGYSQFEVDKKKFLARGPDGSRAKDHLRDDDDRTYTIQIDITPDRIVHKMKVGDEWFTLDSQPAKGASDGKFGFVIPGNEEIGISDLHFTPR
jgi:hypothetical protein